MMRIAPVRVGCIALAATFMLAAAAHAQVRRPPAQPRVLVTGWGGGYTDMGGIVEPAVQVGDVAAFIRFGNSIAYGGGVHFPVSQGLIIGVDGSYSRPNYEVFPRTGGGPAVRSGDASVASGLLSARLASGGGGRVGLYLTGAVGAFAYDIPEDELDGWDTDLALYAGAGLEYMLGQRLPLFLEWGQFWAYHQGEGTQSNTANHRLLRLGLRVGF